MSAGNAASTLSHLLAAAVVRGAPILIAALGELTAERAGVLNLGVEGVMLLGAMAGFAVTAATGNPWLGLACAFLIGAALGLLYAGVVVSLRADQVVSGLALGFVGSGLSSVLGAPLAAAPQKIESLPQVSVPYLQRLPLFGPALFDTSVIVYLGLLLLLLTSLLMRTRLGLRISAVGENPAAADAMGISVVRYRYGCTLWGAALAGLAGGCLSLAITPMWVDDLTAGQGWIAVGLVVVARWRAVPAAWAALLFGVLRRLPLELQGMSSLLGNPKLGYLFDALPYLGTIVVLLYRTRPGVAKFLAAPTGLGVPYERGKQK
jgi:simple sugar transport system permease protein